jgi:hypothetical protein
MLHRRQLPVVSPCDEFVGREAIGNEPAYCTRCAKTVHDLSGMREREVIALLRKTIGQDVCISYRTREDGSIQLRPERRSLAPLGLALSLAGCAGHLDESAMDTGDCRDAAGLEVPCPPSRFGDAVVPELDEDTGAQTMPARGSTDASEPAHPVGVDADPLESHDGNERDTIAAADDDADPTGSVDPVLERATEEASCVVTDRMRRREQRRRMFMRGKMLPLTDELICEIEAERRRERADRHARRL